MEGWVEHVLAALNDDRAAKSRVAGQGPVLPPARDPSAESHMGHLCRSEIWSGWMRVDEAYGAAGITPAVTDAQFRLTCNGCDTGQTLDEMPLSSVADVTIYSCKEYGQSLVGVKPFKEDAEKHEDAGYRLTDNVVGNKVDLFLDLKPGAPAVLMPPTPVFFE